MINHSVIIRFMGSQPYLSCWQAMRDFTNQRNDDTLDEIWVVEHPPVFTQGQNGKAEHVLQPGTIPVIQTDRGGQITYHGPGQLVVYTLIDVKRKKLTIRELVTHLEQSVIQLLASFKIIATTDCKAPGVYVDHKKICSVGLRIRRGCSYHGLAFNVQMDLEPFSRINPCGYAALEMTQLADLLPRPAVNDTANIAPLPDGCGSDVISHQLIEYLALNLGYTDRLNQNGTLYGT